MSCSDRIVRVTYPKNCCPEVDDSQQLLYNGPALQCINVQTNQAFNEAIKEIDALICNTLNNIVCCPTTTTTSSSSSSTSTSSTTTSTSSTTTSTSSTTSTTTSTTTQAPPPSICWIVYVEGGTTEYANFPIGTSPALYNGKVWYGSATDGCIYWNSTLNKWVYDLNGLGGGALFGELDNNNNSYPISDSIYQWSPGCGESVNDTICSSEATSCPETICFLAVSENFGSVNQTISPEATLVNGKVWYKFIVDILDPEVLYIYWDNSSTYQPGGAWVVAYAMNTGLTPPFATTSIFSYLPSSTSNYPNDCVSGCTPVTWTNTIYAISDFTFYTFNRGVCTPE
jgi:hypothetical protein